jgi:hypothetical protein
MVCVIAFHPYCLGVVPKCIDNLVHPYVPREVCGLLAFDIVASLGFAPFFAEPASEGLFPSQLFLFKECYVGERAYSVGIRWNGGWPCGVLALLLPL